MSQHTTDTGTGAIQTESGSLQRALRGLIRIVRPGNTALVAVSTSVGAACGGGSDSWLVALACGSLALIAAGGYVINDVFDYEIDCINRPDRPLPRGNLSRGAATVYSLFLYVAGIMLAVPLGTWHLTVAAAISLALTIYAWKLKRTMLLGNLLVAFISGTAFYYGGMTGTTPVVSLVPSLLAGLFHLGRELIKAAADKTGDEAQGAYTVAVRWGERAALRMAVVPLCLVILLSPLPVWFGWFGWFYLIVVIGLVDTVLACVSFRAWKHTDAHVADRLATILKWDMLAGLTAVLGDIWIQSLI